MLNRRIPRKTLSPTQTPRSSGFSVVVAVPWIASGLAMGLALGTWIERGA